MRMYAAALCLSVVAIAAYGESFLKAASFPKTFDDVSFVDRLEITRSGYEPWESEYDSNGNCISGCPYPGITIEDDLDMMQRHTDRIVAQLQAQGLIPTETPQPSAPTPTTPSTPTVPTTPTTPQPTTPTPTTPTVPQPTIPTQPTQPVTPSPTPSPSPAPAPRCNPYQPEINSTNAIPLGEPVVGHPRITSPFGDRIHPVTGVRTPHRGVDLGVPRGTNVFTPASGTVTNVWTDSNCGRGIVITHANGYATTYCHLEEQLVKPGEIVTAGCLIGRSGNTGRSTGPHLHYGIKQNGTYINPIKLMGRN